MRFNLVIQLIIFIIVNVPSVQGGCKKLLLDLNHQHPTKIDRTHYSNVSSPGTLATQVLRERLEDSPQLEANEKSAIVAYFETLESGVCHRNRISQWIAHPFQGVQQGETIEVVVPKGYENSFLDYAIRLHEAEHLIQMKALMKEISEGTFVLLSLLDFGGTQFRMEEGAMKMEWRYLGSAPREALERLNVQILAETQFTEREKRRYTRFLNLNDLDAKDYLASEYKSFRYSRTACFLVNPFSLSAITLLIRSLLSF